MPRVSGELAASVGGDSNWHAETGNPVEEENGCSGGRRHVLQWNSFKPSGGAVYDGEDVLETISS